MKSELIKKHLDKFKSEKTFDSDYVDILQECNENDEDGEAAASKIIAVMAKRYAENKKDTA